MMLVLMKRMIIFFAVLGGVSYFACSNVDRVAFFCINKFSDYSIEYRQRGGNPFTGVALRDVRIGAKKEEIGLTAVTTNLVLDFRRSIQEGRAVFRCGMTGVSFDQDGDRRRTEESDSLFTIPFRSNWKYDVVEFDLAWSICSMSVEKFSALSDGIKVDGNLKYASCARDLAAEMHMSLGPDASKTMLGELREVLLLPEANGWYGISMKVKGNTRSKKFQVTSDTLDININSN